MISPTFSTAGRTTSRLGLLMLLLPVLLVSGTLLGQPTEDDGVTVSLQFSKQSLETVVSALAKAGNMTIVLGGDLQKKEISAFFTDTPIDQVLETIAASQELQVVREGGCILLVTRKEYMASHAPREILPLKRADPEAMAKTLSDQAPASVLIVAFDQPTRSLVLTGTPERIREARELAEKLDRSLQNEVFLIQYASAVSVAELVREALGYGNTEQKWLGSVVLDERSNRLIVWDSAENLELCRTLIAELDIPVESRVFSTGKIDPKVVAEQVRKGELGTAGGETAEGAQSARRSTESNVRVVEGTNQIIVTDTPERLDILETIMEELNRNIRTEIIRPRNAMPRDIADLLTGAFPEASISVDSRTGSLVITAHRERIEEIVDILTELDADENIQVDIEAKIMLVSTTKLKSLGVRIYGSNLGGFDETLANMTINPNFLADNTKATGSALGSAAGSSLQSPTKTSGSFLEVLQPTIDARAVVRALESDGDTTVLSNPKIRTLVGKLTSIFDGSKEPYKTTTFQDNVSQENVEFEDVGVSFDVTPFHRPGGVISLEVLTDLSTLREVRDGVPVVDQREVESTVEARNGETLFLGGLITQEKIESRAGIPFLKSLWGLGWLFGEKKGRTIQKELVIVITPTIVEPATSLGSVAAIPAEYHAVTDAFGPESDLEQ